MTNMTPDGQLTDTGEFNVRFGIKVLSRACYTNSEKHGWWPETGRNFGELMALIHSEVSEALEAYRDNDNMQEIRYAYNTATGPQVLLNSSFFYKDHTELGKPVGVASELADVVIRVMDLCAALKIPIEDAIIAKHAYNVTRDFRHGGKAC